MSQLQRSKLLKITFEEIKKATEDFKHCIGNGGYGMVYKGVLIISGKPTPVAIKRLINNKHHGQGEKEFLTEIELLSGQKHPNLIYLVGYCDDGGENIIVYEYAKHGSLDTYLLRSNATLTHSSRTHTRRTHTSHARTNSARTTSAHTILAPTTSERTTRARSTRALTWLERLKVCVDAARGVNRSYVVSYACGTYGYCEPEYVRTSIVTKESDVYSFGIVLFEVLNGRLCTTLKNNDGSKLPYSPKEYYVKSSFDDIVDPSLKGEETVQNKSFKEEMDMDSMKRFAEIACECLRDKRKQRPTMNLVVKMLQKLLDRQVSCVNYFFL
ncbi:putative protein kinase RLK-Pelle-LRR-Xb-1 family [Helianthus debilis subsp. tardiflorus]